MYPQGFDLEMLEEACQIFEIKEADRNKKGKEILQQLKDCLSQRRLVIITDHSFCYLRLYKMEGVWEWDCGERLGEGEEKGVFLYNLYTVKLRRKRGRGIS